MNSQLIRSIRNIAWLMSMDSTCESEVGLIENAAIIIEKGKIVWVGSEKDCPKPNGQGKDIDASGLVVMPGMIDCHTHLVFAGDRVEDFYQRARGTSYADILKSGGGISRTVGFTRAASDKELIDNSLSTLKRMLARGVTTVEVKSGYGLNLDDEIKILTVVKELNRIQPVRLVPTFLGAHAIAPEFAENPDGYVAYLIETVLPAISKQQLAQFVDVFVERGAFTKEQGNKILNSAKAHGFKTRIHADQLSHSGGALLAASVGSVSASHLEHASIADIEAMGKAGVVAEVLPLSELYLGLRNVADIQTLRCAKIKIAVATDFNPGSAMCDDLQLALRLAVTYRGLTVEEALLSVTYNAACALSEQNTIGQLKTGMRADVCLFKGRSPWSLVYDWTTNPVQKVIINGQLVA